MSENILSPCNGICVLDYDSGLCKGCFRSSEEITDWSSMSAESREFCMNVLLPEREEKNN